MPASRNLLQKIWDLHAVIPAGLDEETLLYVDRNFVHEESTWAFDSLKSDGMNVARPSSNYAFADHYVPTVRRECGLDAVSDPDAQAMLIQLTANANEYGLRCFGMGDPQQGIMHVVAPELGLVLPGFIVTGSDSHTCTHGALGALGFGVGQTDLRQVFQTQTVWRKRPKSMLVAVDGTLGSGVSAKDVILTIIGIVGANGAAGYLVEYTGSTIRAMSMEQRMTICNMSIEMGALAGLVAPDDTTYAYLAQRPHAPKGAALDEAVRFWRTLPSDTDALFDKTIAIDGAAIEPMVTWGTSLEDVVGIRGTVPHPDGAEAPHRRARMERALAYMGLSPGQPLCEIAIDQVFIGSCTNARIEDLRVAASIVKGRRAIVPGVVSPGSNSVKRQAEADGLDVVFKQAGFDWRASGCSMCVGSNGDIVESGRRCASTSPRNFEGRQGVGARTHVMSPAMAAAAALRGHITDVRAMGVS